MGSSVILADDKRLVGMPHASVRHGTRALSLFFDGKQLDFENLGA